MEQLSLTFGIPFAAFGLALLLHWGALRWFPRWGWLDFPERYGLNRKRLPYPTGIIAIVVFLIMYMTAFDMTRQAMGVVIGVALLGVTCFIDDRKRLSPYLRLSLQILVALIIFLTGTRIFSITNPFIPDGAIKLDTIVFKFGFFYDPPLWSGLFTLVWLTLTINALNWFDGIPGQVSSLSSIGFAVIGLLSLSSRVDQPELALIAFILAGISAASFLFDFPPNRVLMGDTGAMFLGLMLGVLTIYTGGKVATAFLVLGVPLIDSGIVIARRILKGVSPARSNAHDEHLHHRLLAKGWSARQVILLTAVLGTSFGVTALFLSTFEKFIAAIALFSVMFFLHWMSGNKKGAASV